MRRTTLLTFLITLAVITTGATSRTKQEELREEFRQSYTLTPEGRISLSNLNGSVTIKAWDRDEVRIEAVKRAFTQERLQEAEIRIDASPNLIRIETKYPNRSQTFTADVERRRNNPALVDYSLTVPKRARLDSIEVINGSLDLEDLSGDVKASAINGRVIAKNLNGPTKLSSINGSLEVSFARLDESKPIALSAVNGNITLTLPSDSNAEVKASTVHGVITNEFGLAVRRGQWVGSSLNGQIGSGGARIKIDNVNGQINIKRASDGRALSSVKDLMTVEEDPRIEIKPKVKVQVKTKPGEVVISDAEAEEIRREVQRDVQREASLIAREVQREVAEAMREAQREIARASAEASVATRETMRAAAATAPALIERNSRTFNVTAAPRVFIETFAGSVTVRGWDRADVVVNTMKRAAGRDSLSAISVNTEQRGSEIRIRATAADQTSSGAATRASTSVEVFVPRKASLRIVSGDGRVGVSDVAGDSDLRTRNGVISVEESSGKFSVTTESGRLQFVNFNGELTAHAKSGGIALSGNFSKLIARADQGSISLNLPIGFSGVIETQARDVTSSGVAATEEGGTGSAVRRWRVGKGGNALNLQAPQGSVTIRSSGSR